MVWSIHRQWPKHNEGLFQHKLARFQYKYIPRQPDTCTLALVPRAIFPISTSSEAKEGSVQLDRRHLDFRRVNNCNRKFFFSSFRLQDHISPFWFMSNHLPLEGMIAEDAYVETLISSITTQTETYSNMAEVEEKVVWDCLRRA